MLHSGPHTFQAFAGIKYSRFNAHVKLRIFNFFITWISLFYVRYLAVYLTRKGISNFLYNIILKLTAQSIQASCKCFPLGLSIASSIRECGGSIAGVNSHTCALQARHIRIGSLHTSQVVHATNRSVHLLLQSFLDLPHTTIVTYLNNLLHLKVIY